LIGEGDKEGRKGGVEGRERKGETEGGRKGTLPDFYPD